LFSIDNIPPALRAFAPPGASLSYPKQGMTSEVALVEGPLPCVVKRCCDPRYLDWLSREHAALQALADSPLPMPRALAFFAEERERWLVTSRLEGEALWPVMLDATAARRAVLLRRVGALLKQLHSTPLPPTMRSTSSWIDRMLSQAQQNLPWCDGNAALLEDVHRRRPAPVPEVLIHGDLALDNVLVATGDAMSLIDWSGGGQGDPRIDVAFALQSEPEFALGELERAAFYDGYGGTPIDSATQQWFTDLNEFF
jgi:aminoglycoside phosphotransferase (APT) family kinase protein